MTLSSAPLGRRSFLRFASVTLAGAGWMTPLGHLLAQKAERERQPAQSVILLWMAGGPSQLETFDPHPGTDVAAGSRAISTRVRDVQLAEGYEELADVMDSVSLIRSMVSKEGDHERGTYLMKTGYRPDPTVEHPSIGAIACHELPVGKTEIPRHISIMPNQWSGRGGFLGAEYDAFKSYDPAQKLPDITPRVAVPRDQQRLRDLDVVERAFVRGREKRVEATLHQASVRHARVMMTSEQLRAFDITLEPERVRKAYGDTPFGRACLAARRLTEVGVRCVEVTLNGWDSHLKNHELHAENAAILSPAFAALVRDLKERGTFDQTVVLCAGEFGRTPKMNPAGGRDHWPKGFSVALAGGGIGGGRVIGATDPEGKDKPTDPHDVPDVHATVLTALGLDPMKENNSPIGRPLRLSPGRAIEALLG